MDKDKESGHHTDGNPAKANGIGKYIAIELIKFSGVGIRRSALARFRLFNL